jgi:transcriptional regulator with XRE-family HTH domain
MEGLAPVVSPRYHSLAVADPLLDLSQGLGGVIRWLRQHGGELGLTDGRMSQAELGRRAGGFVRQAVTNWEKGRRMPDLPTTDRIAAVLGIAAWQLVRAGQLAAGGMAAGAAVAMALRLDQSEAADVATRAEGGEPLDSGPGGQMP